MEFLHQHQQTANEEKMIDSFSVKEKFTFKTEFNLNIKIAIGSRILCWSVGPKH